MTPHALEITPRGSGGVSIVAVRGPGALELVAPLCSATPSAGDFRLVRITDGEEELDEALLLCDSPESVELHVHGSPAVVRRLLSALRERGALDPPEGLPLELEERAEQRLAFSAGEAGARILLDQAEGALRRELEALSMERAGFQARARRLLARSRFALRAIEPTSVCLLGRPNAGKSTLFNALLGARRVVESAEAGTTRDTIRERVRLGAYPVDLVDTAGLSPGRTPGRTRGRTPGRGPEVAPPLDAESQRLARRALEASELGLWLQPVGEPTHQAEEPAGGPPLLRVATFADRVEPRPPGAISALRDPTGARSAVTELFRSAFELPTDPWTPGGAALFERELLDALEHATRAGAPERERILAGLLAPASGVGAGAGVGRAAIGAPDVVGRAPRG